MEIITSTTVLLTISIGFCGFLLFYILKLIRNEQAARAISSKKITDKNEHKKTQSGGGVGTKSKKKPTEKHSQNPKQSQWLLTTLKGHTEQVLNIDISTNGKYLASCSEDSVDNCDNTTTTTRTTTTQTTTRKEKIIDTKDKKTKIKRKRRRKKRSNKTITTTTTTTTTIKFVQNDDNRKTMIPLKEFTIFNNSLLKSGYNPDNDMTKLFERYLLTEQEQNDMGYPLFSSDHVKFYYHYHDNKQQLDVNAKIFKPQMLTTIVNNNTSNNSNNDDDSGRSSGNSSDTESSSTSAYNNNKFVNNLHKCIRCSSIFSIYNEDIYIANNFCCYHHGKLINVLSDNQQEFRYSCCYGYKNAFGCTTQQFHVFNGYNYGWNGPFYDYFTITKPTNLNRINNVYGIDCEMCYTTQGLEVTKLTIVHIDGTIVYNTLIKPYNKILDYNTRYSGITPRMLQENINHTKTLKQVQNELKMLINPNTIIIGHGLENDLRCLKFIHKRCIDTVKLFPHDLGLPYRNSLKNLVHKYLKRTIQNHNHLGHDSYEDACACIELVLWKIRKDLQREKL